MYFLIENDDLLEKYNTIWDKFGSVFLTYFMLLVSFNPRKHDKIKIKVKTQKSYTLKKLSTQKCFLTCFMLLVFFQGCIKRLLALNVLINKSSQAYHFLVGKIATTSPKYSKTTI